MMPELVMKKPVDYVLRGRLEGSPSGDTTARYEAMSKIGYAREQFHADTIFAHGWQHRCRNGSS